jgi:hypothetical protein
MATKRKTRRLALALATLAAPVSLSLASPAPAAADTILPRLSTGGCITGIADTHNGQPVCRIVGGSTWSGTTNYSDGGIW